MSTSDNIIIQVSGEVEVWSRAEHVLLPKICNARAAPTRCADDDTLKRAQAFADTRQRRRPSHRFLRSRLVSLGPRRYANKTKKNIIIIMMRKG